MDKDSTKIRHLYQPLELPEILQKRRMKETEIRKISCKMPSKNKSIAVKNSQQLWLLYRSSEQSAIEGKGPPGTPPLIAVPILATSRFWEEKDTRYQLYNHTSL